MKFSQFKTIFERGYDPFKVEVTGQDRKDFTRENFPCPFGTPKPEEIPINIEGVNRKVADWHTEQQSYTNHSNTCYSCSNFFNYICSCCLTGYAYQRLQSTNDPSDN